MNDDRPIGNDAWKEPPVLRWGIDISSTKIEGVIIDEAEPGKALCRIRLPMERFHAYDHFRGYDQIISQVQFVIEQLEETSNIKRPKRIGISTPGVIEPSSGVLKNSNILCFNGYSLRNDLSEALGMEVLLANDANCFTLAEVTLGAARGFKVVMGLIIETGIGAGIVVHGHLLEGTHGIAGEWGHNRLQGKNALCCCGKKGCNEMVFSAPALERFYEKKTGLELPLLEIIKRAELEETDAVKTLQRLQESFAEAIAIPINILDPDAIVIGGNIGSIDVLYTDETRHKITSYIFNKELKTRFLKPQLGDSAGVFGAAMLTIKKP